VAAGIVIGMLTFVDADEHGDSKRMRNITVIQTVADPHMLILLTPEE